MTSKINSCPICGECALTEKHNHSFLFKHGRKMREVTELSQTICSACNVKFFSSYQLKKNHEKVVAFQAQLRDYISPKQVLELREKYELTQTEANKIFGGGPTAFSKYERGISNPVSSASRQMLTALHDPIFMQSIAKSYGLEIRKGVPIEQCRELIDAIPKELRVEIENYAANLRMSRWDALSSLLSKGLEASRKDKGADQWGHEIGVSYAVDYEYEVLCYNLERQNPQEKSTKIEFVAPLKQTLTGGGKKNA
jgi:HTH-type transcriptional regulator/antitoxin MqsA